MLHFIYNALRQIPLFENLDLVRHAELIERVQMFRFSAGHVVFHAGDPADRMYVVKSGAVEISATRDDVEKVLATITPGGFFGEMALIHSAPRNATARAVVDTEVFILNHDTLVTLLSDVPEADVRLTEEYLRRREANK